MMYTCGDVRNVLVESAELVEDIVHGQLIELVGSRQAMDC
jgi:hypothetical protein